MLDSDYLVSKVNHMNTLEYSKQVAENVSKALDGANLSVSAAAEKTGIPRTTLSRHLNHPISIHAPQWGATIERVHVNFPLTISIHAPQWGATA